MESYALKEISRRKGKYALNMALIGAVTFVLIVLNSLGIAYKEASRLPFQDVQSSIIVQRNGNVPENTTGPVTSCSMAPIRCGMLDSIKAIPGVTGVSSGLSLWVFDEDNFKRVLGVNWDDGLGKKVQSNLVKGTVPKTDQDVLIDETYAQHYGKKIGETVMVSQKDFIISGIVKSSNNVVASDLFMNMRPAQDLAYNSINLQNTQPFEPNDINIIFIDAEQTRIDEVAAALKNLLNPAVSGAGQTPTGNQIGTYAIYTPESFESCISALFVLSDKLVWLISAVVVVGSALLLVQTSSHTMMERRKEFGVMKSVGFTGADIQKQFLAETTLQAGIGYGVGLVAALLAIQALSHTQVSIHIPWELSPYPHFLTSDPSLIDTVQTYLLPVRFQTGYALLSFAIVFLISTLTVSILTGRINRLKAMEVLRA